MLFSAQEENCYESTLPWPRLMMKWSKELLKILHLYIYVIPNLKSLHVL